MATLASCIKRHGELLSRPDRESLEKVAKKYIQDGYKPEVANISALEDALTDLELEHKDILDQVRDLEGAELAKKAQDQFPWEEVAPRPKPEEKAQAAKEEAKPSPKEEVETAPETQEQRIERVAKEKVAKMGKGKPGEIIASDEDRVRFIQYLFKDVKPAKELGERRNVVLTGGPTGAGKSTALNGVIAELRKYVRIDPDRIKEFAGHAGETSPLFHEESSRIAVAAIEIARDEGYHYIFDSRLGNFKKAEARIKEAQEAGEPIFIGFANIDLANSRMRSITRALLQKAEGEQSRLVKDEVILEGINESLPTFLALWDKYKGAKDVFFSLFDNGVDGSEAKAIIEKNVIVDPKSLEELRENGYTISGGGRYELRNKVTGKDLERSSAEINNRIDNELLRQGYQGIGAQGLRYDATRADSVQEILEKWQPFRIDLTEANQKQAEQMNKEARAERAPPHGSSVSPPAAATPKQIIKGMPFKVYTASQMEGIPIHYAIIEASDLIPSHDPMSFAKRSDYPEGVQEREYHRDKHEQAKVIDHARNLKTPLLLTNNPDAVNGPPIIMQNGIVLGGNSRAMTLIRAYEDGPMGVKYKTKLAMFANQFGVTSAQVEGMRRPVLVRVTDEISDDPKELHRMASVFNEPMIQALSTEAKMVSMGKNVAPASVQRIGMMMAETDETIRGLLDKKSYALEILNMLHNDGIITKSQLNKYWNEKRDMINDEGKRLVEGVLMGSVIDDADLLRDTPPSIMQKISRSLADLTKIRGRGGDWDITGTLKLALDLIISAKANGTSIAEYLQVAPYSQTSFLDRTDFTPKSIVLAHALQDLKQKEWNDAVSNYAKDAHLDVEGQGVLLVTFAKPDDSFKEHFGTLAGGESLEYAASRWTTKPGLFDRQIGELELDEGTKAFIERKVRKLGSYERVSDFYTRNDIVGKYALALARERYGVEEPKRPGYEVRPYGADMDIRNVEALPKGTGARYLLAIKGLKDEVVAKAWKRKPPENIGPNEVLIDMEPTLSFEAERPVWAAAESVDARYQDWMNAVNNLASLESAYKMEVPKQGPLSKAMSAITRKREISKAREAEREAFAAYAREQKMLMAPEQASLWGKQKAAFELTPSEATIEEKIAEGRKKGELAPKEKGQVRRAAIPEEKIQPATAGEQAKLFEEMETQKSLFYEPPEAWAPLPLDAGVEISEPHTKVSDGIIQGHKIGVTIRGEGPYQEVNYSFNKINDQAKDFEPIGSIGYGWKFAPKHIHDLYIKGPITDYVKAISKEVGFDILAPDIVVRLGNNPGLSNKNAGNFWAAFVHGERMDDRGIASGNRFFFYRIPEIQGVKDSAYEHFRNGRVLRAPALAPATEKQMSLINWSEEKAPEGERTAQVVRMKTTGNLMAQSLHVETADEVASLVSKLRKASQEEMWIVGTDIENNVIEIFRHGKGTSVQTSASVIEQAGRVLNMPGIKNAWLIHNHPPGQALFSQPDINVFTLFSKLLEGAGINAAALVVGKNEYAAWKPGVVTVMTNPIRPVLRKVQIPIKERGQKIVKEENPQVDPRDLRATKETIRDWAHKRDGFLLLDPAFRPVVYVPVIKGETRGDMTRRIIATSEPTNAMYGIGYVVDPKKTPATTEYMMAIYSSGGFYDFIVPDVLMGGKMYALEMRVPQQQGGVRTFKNVLSETKFRAMPKAETMETTPAFKEWFGKSVVTKDGKPRIMYHGTFNVFSAFNPQQGAYRTLDIGSHFGTATQADRILRDKTAEEKKGIKPVYGGAGASIMPVYLSIKHPLRITDTDMTDVPTALAEHLFNKEFITKNDYDKVLKARADLPYGSATRLLAERNALRDMLERKGFDGLVYKNLFEGGGDSYVAFRPEQIKSVFNRGTWSPESKNISLRAWADNPAPFISKGPEQPYHLTKRDIIHAKAIASLIPGWLKKAGATPDILKRIRWELKPFVDLREADIEKTLREWNQAGVEVKDVGAAVTINRMNALVQISSRIKNMDELETTALHEYYHIVRAWLLPPDVIRKMDTLFKTEEEQAEAFAHYIKTMQLPQGEIGTLKKAWATLRRILQEVANWIRGKGFASAEEIFKQIAVGTFDTYFHKPTAAYTTMLEVAAYHGSDTVFDRFSSDHIGSGEGGAAFGWGLYFSEIEDVAKWYAANAVERNRYSGVKVKGQRLPAEGWYARGADSHDLWSMVNYIAKTLAQMNESKEYATATGEGELAWAKSNTDLIIDKFYREGGFRPETYEYKAFKQLADFYQENLKEARPEDVQYGEPKKTIYKVTLAKGKAPAEHEWLPWHGLISQDQLKKIEAQGKKENNPILANYAKIRDILSRMNDIISLPSEEHNRRQAELLAQHDALVAELRSIPSSGKFTYIPGWAATPIMDTRLYEAPRGEHFYEALSELLGSKREASLFLHRAGIPGIAYNAGSLSGIKTEKLNYVIFDDSLITIEGVTHFRPQDVLTAGQRAANLAKANIERLKRVGEMDQKQRINEAQAYFDKFEGWGKDQVGTIKEIVQAFKNQKKGWDIEKPDTTVLERLLQSAEFYWEKVPAAWRVLQASIKRQDRFHMLYQAITNDDEFISRMKALKEQRPTEYDRLAKLIQMADMNQVAYTAKQLEDKGFSPQAISAWEGYRKLMDRTHDLLMQDLIALQQRYLDAGKPFPDIVTWEGDKRIQINLNVALARMGRLKGFYAPRPRTPGRFAIIAKKPGGNPRLEFADLVTTANQRAAELEKEGYQVTRTPSNRLPEDVFATLGKTLSIQSLMNNAMDRVLRQDKLSLDDFGLRSQRVDREIDGQKVSTLIIQGPTSKKMNAALKALGGRFYSWPKRQGAPKAWVFSDAPPAMEARIIKTLAEGASVTEAIETELLFAHAITTEVSNMIKGRGFRSAMIRRSQAVGSDVWLGYETDPLKAMSLHAMGVAAGIAKKETAMEMWRAATGTDISPDAYKNYEEYLDAVRERRIDATKQGNIYHDVMKYIDEVLRNQEMNDRVIGIVKGLAVLKYIGFRVASPLINLTALATSVPASMHGYAGVSFLEAPKYMTNAMGAYFKYLTGKGDQLDPDTKKTIEEIIEKGWDQAQFNREALNVLNSRLEGAYQTAVRYSMFVFGKTEQLNRVSTILGTYLALRDKAGKGFDREEGLNKAKFVSDRAHGIYGKETLPYIAQGSNPAAQAAKMFYVFSKFSHTYLQNMYHLGFKEGDKKALVYMMLAPAVLAGIGAAPLIGKPLAYAMGKLLGAMGAGGPPEGEENLFAWLENWLGRFTSNLFRHGLLGAGGYGISSKGSLAIDFAQNFPTTLPEFLGAPASAAVDLYDAAGQLVHGNVYRAVEKAAPRFISEPMKIGREYQTGITTERGVPKYLHNELMKPTVLDVLYKVMNFTPAHYATMKEQKWAETETIKFYQEWRSDIYERARYLYSLPAAQRDEADIAGLTADIDRYNQRVKSRQAYTIKGISYIDRDDLRTAIMMRR